MSAALLFLMSLSHCAVIQDAAAAQPPPQQANVGRHDAPGVRIAPRLTPELGDRDVHRISEVLSLSEEQRKLWNDLFAEYLKEHRAVLAEQTPAFDDLNAAAAATASVYDHEALERFRAFYSAEEKIRDRLVKAQGRLLGNLQAILSEGQLERWPRVQWRCERARYLPLGVDIRGARMDLTVMAEEFGAAASADSVLFEYEAAVTPLMTQLENQLAEDTLRVIEIQVKHTVDASGKALSPGTPEQYEGAMRARAERTKVLTRSARLQRRIAEVNRQFVDRIADTLQDPARRFFREEFLVLAFPLVYPNEECPLPAVDSVLSSPTLSEGLREAVKTLREGYLSDYGDLCRQMERTTEDWHEQMARTRASIEYDAYAKKMRTLRSERWARGSQLLQQVLTTLPPEFDASLREGLQASRNLIAEAEQVSQEDRYPGQ
jgi:hypothetical protein